MEKKNNSRFVVFICAVYVYRHHGADCFSVCTGSRISGECFCHFGHQKFAVPADPAHAAYGPPRRNLEAAGICSLCPQQGDPWHLFHSDWSRLSLFVIGLIREWLDQNLWCVPKLKSNDQIFFCHITEVLLRKSTETWFYSSIVQQRQPD